jgi:hypothetical protein
MATKLLAKALPSFKRGYNSYTQSKSLVDDQEIPYGSNVWLDDNGSATKRTGSSRYSAVISSGHAVMGLGRFKTSTINKVIAACNTSLYAVASGTSTALTGVTFTADKSTDFMQAFDTFYAANGTDALAYTTNGTSLTSVAANGNIGRWPVFYNQRIYMTNTANPDRIYYSNPYALSLAAPPTLTGFDTANLFNTDLTATPKKNAGFIVLQPGAGLEITRLFVDGDTLYCYTKTNIWKITPVATANADGSIAHTVSLYQTSYGTPGGRSIVKVGNDQWFYGNDNLYSLGEVALYQNIRVSPKSGRVKSEITSITNSGRATTAAGFYNSKVYFAYTTGTYNDRILVYDTILNAWSTPFTGENISCFLEIEESDGTRRFLGGSSLSTDSYVYELNTGSNDQSTAISAVFETKSTDCDKPGLIKRFAFIKVFYGLLFGTITYEVFIDEVSSLTGTVQLGNSTSRTVGIGTQAIGTFPVGRDYDTSTTFASLASNSDFTIDCQYKSGKKISVRFTNSNVSEQFKINNIVVDYLPGSVYEN